MMMMQEQVLVEEGYCRALVGVKAENIGGIGKKAKEDVEFGFKSKEGMIVIETKKRNKTCLGCCDNNFGKLGSKEGEGEGEEVDVEENIGKLGSKEEEEEEIEGCLLNNKKKMIKTSTSGGGPCISKSHPNCGIESEPVWPTRFILVRVISKVFQGGRWYGREGKVGPEVAPKIFDIVLVDGSREIVHRVPQHCLAPALLRVPKEPVIVVRGERRALYGRVVEMDSVRGTALIREADTKLLFNFGLRQIAHYFGSSTYLGYEDDFMEDYI